MSFSHSLVIIIVVGAVSSVCEAVAHIIEVHVRHLVLVVLVHHFIVVVVAVAAGLDNISVIADPIPSPLSSAAADSGNAAGLPLRGLRAKAGRRVQRTMTDNAQSAQVEVADPLQSLVEEEVMHVPQRCALVFVGEWISAGLIAIYLAILEVDVFVNQSPVPEAPPWLDSCSCYRSCGDRVRRSEVRDVSVCYVRVARRLQVRECLIVR